MGYQPHSCLGTKCGTEQHGLSLTWLGDLAPIMTVYRLLTLRLPTHTHPKRQWPLLEVAGMHIHIHIHIINTIARTPEHRAHELCGVCIDGMDGNNEILRLSRH